MTTTLGLTRDTISDVYVTKHGNIHLRINRKDDRSQVAHVILSPADADALIDAIYAALSGEE